ncbi:phage tail tape measure protein [Vibrio cholerae]|nr:phage tail tape measure protein [Vibrio cholerae]ELY5254389.1 phage tail tape measure protein [Vibrio cholerae]HCJ6872928.1 phage tail tape measure protein [Vibrio cholerae]
MNEKLMMVIGLVDQVTKPLQGITKEMQGAMDIGRKGLENVAVGAGGLVAAGLAVQGILGPAIEVDRALSKSKGFGIVGDDLKKIERAAYGFSIQYGHSAVDFINTSSMMISAIGNMSGEVLTQVTRNSSALAVAMQSDSETVSKLMKTIYGNYKADADLMGKDVFTATVSGMIVEAKQIYGIGMSELEGMIDGMHSLPSTIGMTFDDQLAVFGTLRAQMSEGDAVTQMTNFAEGLATFEEKVGINLRGADGQILPMVELLEKVKPLIEGMSGLDARTFLDDAGLGDGSLMLINLIKQQEEFVAGQKRLSQVQGMGKTEQMVSDMADQWQRLEASWFAIRAATFGAILPSINAIVGTIANGISYVTEFTNRFPMLTKVMSGLAVVGLSLGGVVASLSLALGVGQMMSGGWAATIKILSLAMKINRIFVIAWSAAVMIASGDFALMGVIIKGTIARIWAMTAATKVGQFATIGWSYATKVAQLATLAWSASVSFLGSVLGVLRTGIVAVITSTWLFNAALWANPITWIIAGIVALVAAVGAMIYWWDEIKASFADTTWFKIIAAAIDGVIEMLNMIPGINIEWRAGELPDVPVPETQPAIAKAVPVLPDVAALEASRPSMDSTLIDYKRPENTPQLSKNMVNNLNSSESRTTHNVRQFGDVYITPQGGMTPEQLAEWDELNAG